MADKFLVYNGNLYGLIEENIVFVDKDMKVTDINLADVPTISESEDATLIDLAYEIEKRKVIHSDEITTKNDIMRFCPSDYGICSCIEDIDYCGRSNGDCEKCWNRKVSEVKNEGDVADGREKDVCKNNNR